MTDQGWTVRAGLVPALLWPDDENPDMPFSLTEADLAETLPFTRVWQVAAAFAALRDALARDAQVREIVQRWESDADVEFEHVLIDLTALYAPSPGVRVDSEEQQ